MSLDFVAIDFETAGLDRGTPCAVGMVRYRDGDVVDKYEKLIKPVPRDWNSEQSPLEDFFHPMCVNVHGITASDVSAAPTFFELWPEMQAFMENLPLIAHNASFDMGVLRASMERAELQWPVIDYGCTLVWGRCSYDLTSYQLPFLSDAAGVQFSSAEHHGALYDAEISGKILLAIARKNEVDDLEGINSKLGTRMGQIRPDMWHGCALKSRSNGWGPKVSAKDVIVSADADKEHPLYGVGVTFTGALTSMSRSEAQQLVARFGGQPLDGVTKKTNFLVFGEQDATKLRPGATKSAKYEKAVSLKHAGANIEVISEGDFLNMIADGSDSGIR